MRQLFCAWMLLTALGATGGCGGSAPPPSRSAGEVNAPAAPTATRKDVDIRVPGVHVEKENDGDVNVQIGRQAPRPTP